MPLDRLQLPALTFLDMRRVEPTLDALRTSPLSADHDVVSRLVPEVVAELGRVLLPLALHLQRLGVDEREGALVVAGCVAERADHDVAVGEAVGGVRHRAVERVVEHVRLDDREVSRRARLRSDVDEVNAVASERGQHKLVPRLARVVMATGAGVPSGVVQLVADVRHGQAVDDLSTITLLSPAA